MLSPASSAAAHGKHKQTLLDKLSYEMAILKRLKFAAKTGALNADQRSLLEDALEEDLQAVDEEIEQLHARRRAQPTPTAQAPAIAGTTAAPGVHTSPR